MIKENILLDLLTAVFDGLKINDDCCYTNIFDTELSYTTHTIMVVVVITVVVIVLPICLPEYDNFKRAK